MKDMEDLLSGRQRSLSHGMEHFWSMKGCWREEMSELFSPSELEKTLITMNFRLGLAKKKKFLKSYLLRKWCYYGKFYHMIY